MRIRGPFFFRTYHIPTFIIVLLLFGPVLMSLRVKQRQGVAFLDALLSEVISPAQKAGTLVIKISNLGNVQINNEEVNYHRRSIANRQSITTIGSTVYKLQLHLKPSLYLVSIDNHQFAG